MEESNFKDLWKFYWDECNLFGKVLLVIVTPYLWVCYGLANSGYKE